jgi:hypothetical protein
MAHEELHNGCRNTCASLMTRPLARRRLCGEPEQHGPPPAIKDARKIRKDSVDVKSIFDGRVINRKV